ncbi:DinB family protein [Blastococcus sp. TML/M2B]|uniref:DinB family protein n=1 Tax=unclassified Blastococcus TaxID=2619396 RepID=UPI00190DE0DE|nr:MULTISPECIES: DinB family protein [unclassified Blastococcus]MBN1092657.1 DinB family protein [Blastococcus sp. TML/M2B]MBN1097235.1 DinB family protein [Blastococcus sp. TML/C7B]
MTAADDAKADLRTYLQEGRDVLVLKLEGLSEYDLRRPRTPTGTNLLGLVKHLAFVELGYFGPVFGRPAPGVEPWMAEEGEPNWDMWATPEETRADVLARYRRAWALTDATVDELPLDATGRVPWWSRPEVTLHRVLVHVIAETHRHAGHADIVRELLDGSVGNQGVGDNLPDVDEAWWAAHRERLDEVARQAGGR